MTYTAIPVLAIVIWGIYKAACWLDSKLPTREEEEAQGRRDMEELLKRANDEVKKRAHVRAGKPIY